jgi:ribonuclease R
VHITALPGDYYNFDAAKQRLLGERSGRSFSLGGRVRVQVARVDLDDKKIDLELIDSQPPRKSKATAKPRDNRSTGKTGKTGTGKGKGAAAGSAGAGATAKTGAAQKKAAPATRKKRSGKGQAGKGEATDAANPTAKKQPAGAARKGQGKTGLRRRR